VCVCVCVWVCVCVCVCGRTHHKGRVISCNLIRLLLWAMETLDV